MSSSCGGRTAIGSQPAQFASESSSRPSCRNSSPSSPRDAFEPADAELSLDLIGSDYAITALGPGLFREVLRQSPRSTLRFHSWHDGAFADAVRGDADLVFFGGEPPTGLHSESLFTERFACVVAADHPFADHDSLDLAEYLSCAHLVVDVDHGRQPAIDDPLEALGTPRQASLTLPYHAAAFPALAGSVMVATLPERLAAIYLEPGRHRQVEAPRELSTMEYKMVWHAQVNGDPAHAWLRTITRAVAKPRPDSQ